MKNLVVLGLVAVCTVLVSSESVLASGGGGGKQRARARFVMTNVEPQNGATMVAWVRAPGAAVPNTLGQLRRQLVYIAPQATGRSARLRSGSYDIAIADAANLVGPDNTPITMADIAAVVVDNQRFDINGVDRTLNISNGGGLVRTN